MEKLPYVGTMQMRLIESNSRKGLSFGQASLPHYCLQQPTESIPRMYTTVGELADQLIKDGSGKFENLPAPRQTYEPSPGPFGVETQYSPLDDQQMFEVIAKVRHSRRNSL